MDKNHHHSGLTDAQVLESRQKHGANVLTPPAKESTWTKIKKCMHFWLLKVDIAIVIAAAMAAILLPATGAYCHDGLWIAPTLALVLFVLTYFVAFMGGKWDEEEKKFHMDPLFTILLFALLLSGGISFYEGVYGQAEGLQPYFEPIGIALAVLLATTVAHFLEAQNEKTFKSLNEVNDDTPVRVIRNNNVCQVPRKDIVVGDIILLAAGEEVPADAQIIECMNLTMNESSLTGEPQCAKTTDPAHFDKDATYPSNHVLKGCTVMEGDCVAEVFAVGDATACGKVFEAAQVKDGDATPLSRKLDQLATLVSKASYGVGAIIIIGRVLMYCMQDDFSLDGTENIMAFVSYLLNSFMIAVTLVVVAVPEGLPMAVTLSLAFSMKRLMKQNTLPRTMHACETMGAVSVICSDKTGTLTFNQMSVVDSLFPCMKGETDEAKRQQELLKECIAVNTTAHLDFSDAEKTKAVGNPTEGALLLWLNSKGVDYLKLREAAETIDRLQFTTELKYMATVVKSAVTGKTVVYVKGAPDILMAMCCLSEDEKKAYTDKLAEYQSHANRTLAFAYKETETAEGVFADGKLNIKDLTMMGIVGIEDPVRSDVPAAIDECLNAGIQVKIVTGDAPGTAKEIGRQLGLWKDTDTDENLLIGTELAALSDEELKARLPKVKIISRARPNDKDRAVRTLKGLGYVVAVTGDGTNDAPALNAANVGLSMGDGTAVAKEASDMTILDNSFATIANAVMWGRSLYKNIKRFILFQLTVNVVACLIVAIGAFIGTESPLTVTQMLWVNLIMDTFAALALASLPPSKAVMDEKPRSMDEHVLKGMRNGILGVGILFTAILLAILLFFQHSDVTSLAGVLCGDAGWGEYNGLSTYELSLFFTIFVMLQFWNLFNAKAFMTSDSAFSGLSWKDTKCFITIVLVIVIGQILMTETPGLQQMFNIAGGGLSTTDWLLVIALTSLVLWVGEAARLVKRMSKA